jgi:hypothetical protein
MHYKKHKSKNKNVKKGAKNLIKMTHFIPHSLRSAFYPHNRSVTAPFRNRFRILT